MSQIHDTTKKTNCQHLNEAERKIIERQLSLGTPKKQIARLLGSGSYQKKVDKKSKSRFSLDRRKPMIMKVRSDRIIKSIDIFKNSEFQIIERGIRSSISFL